MLSMSLFRPRKVLQRMKVRTYSGCSGCSINPFAALEALKSLTLDADPVDVFTTPDQLDEELVTLTLLPRSRWQTLLNLDVIQVRSSVDYQGISKLMTPAATEQAKGGTKGAGESTLFPANIAWC
jgi:hypothetical protein